MKPVYTNALLTGGSSGIAKALAILLAREGMNVAIVARDEKRLAQAKGEIESARINKKQIVEVFSADVTNFDQIKSVVKSLVDAGRAPELLVNSAGIVHVDYFEKIPHNVFRNVMEVDYFGTLNAVQAALPVMLSRGIGHIVNISSAAGYVGVFGYSAYSPPKFALKGLSEVLRQELKPKGIAVTVVFPPDTMTPQFEEELSHRPAETSAINSNAGVMSAEDVASAILKGIRARKFMVLPGFMNKATYLLSKTPFVRWFCDKTIEAVMKK
jgi:3-dehydrosphinganine reductase